MRATARPRVNRLFPIDAFFLDFFEIAFIILPMIAPIEQKVLTPVVIALPVTVTGLLDKPVNVDLNKIKIEVPQIELPPLDFGPPAK